MVFLINFSGFATPPQEKILNIYNWADYIDPQILEDFSKETHIKIQYSIFEANEVLETKLLTGSAGYDLVVPSSTFAKNHIAANLYQKLDLSLLSNYKNINPKILKILSSHDPSGEYLIPYLWGTNGLAIRAEKVKDLIGELPKNPWDLLFNVQYLKKIHSCGIYVFDSASEVYPLVALYLKQDPYDFSEIALKNIENKLKEIRPYITKFDNTLMIDALARGDICMAIGYSGDLLIAKNEALKASQPFQIEYLTANEPSMSWIDTLAIPSNAANAHNAHLFINYILQPHIMAKITDFVNYSNAITEAHLYAKDHTKNNPLIYPNMTDTSYLPQETISIEQMRLISRSFSRIKASTQ